VEKYGRARQATDENIIRRMRIASRKTKSTDTHSEYVILIAFERQQMLTRIRNTAWGMVRGIGTRNIVKQTVNK
jgi:hypothetical protein